MNQNLLSRVLEFLRRKMWNKRWQRAATCLAAVAVFGVTYALILPAVTMTDIHPKLSAETLSAWSGDELTVRVTAKAEETGKESTFVLKAAEEGADLSPSYAFDEEGVCLITDEEGNEIELHRTNREGKEGVVDYWFTLSSGAQTVFTLDLADEVDETRFSKVVEFVKQEAEEQKDTENADQATASNAERTVPAAAVPSGAAATSGRASASDAVKASSSNADIIAVNTIARTEEEKVVVEKHDDGFEEILDNVVINDLEPEEDEDGVQTEITASLKLSAGVGADYFEAVKDAERNADKRGDAALKFTWKDVTASAVKKTQLSASTDDADITVFYDEDAEIPDDAVLIVSKIDEDSPEYAAYLESAREAVRDEKQDGMDKAVRHASFFDITIMSGNEVVDPRTPVRVVISYHESINVAADSDLDIVHFKDEETTEVLKTGATEGGKDLEAVAFTAESFSVYAVVETAPINTKTYKFILDDENDPYETEILKEAYDGKPAETLQEPKKPEIEGKLFEGWYTEPSFQNLFTDFGEAETYDNTTVKLYGKMVDDPNLAYLYYHDADGSILQTTAVTKGGAVTVVKGTPEVHSLDQHYSGYGWALEPNQGEEDDQSGKLTSISEDTHLYPIMVEGHWLRFDSRGGLYTEPQFLRVGETTVQPATAPTRMGYEFKGWYQDADCTSAFAFGNEISQDTIAYAKWQGLEVEYYVSYWYENANDNGYTFNTSERKTGIAGTMTPADNPQTNPARHMHLRLHQDKDQPASAGHLNVAVEINGDGSTVQHVYYDRDKYPVVWKAVGGRVLYQCQMKHGQKYAPFYQSDEAAALCQYVEDEYENVLWDATWRRELGPNSTWWTEFWHDTSVLDAGQSVEGTMGRTLVWQAKTQNTRLHKIYSYYEAIPGQESQGGSSLAEKLPEPITVEAATSYKESNDSVPQTWIERTYDTCYYREAHFNHGWWWPNYSQGTGFTIDHITGYKRYWIGNIEPKVWVTFNYEPNPSKYSYPVYAYYRREKYDIDFNLMGGQEEVEGKSEGKYDDLFYQLHLDNLEPTNYIVDQTTKTDSEGNIYYFKGWYSDADLTEPFTFQGTDMPSHDLLLYAKWQPVTYTVTYDPNGGTLNSAEKVTVDSGNSTSRPEDPDPKQGSGDVFTGWTVDVAGGMPYDFEKEVTSNITLVANWFNATIYKVKYDLNGGSGDAPVDTNNYHVGTSASVASPGNAEGPDGQAFVGWELEGKLYQPETLLNITRDHAVYDETEGWTITLKARWGTDIEKTDLTYDYNVGKYGFTFKNSEDEEIDHHTVTDLLNNATITLNNTPGGNGDDDNGFTITTGLDVPKGYRFDGWALSTASDAEPVPKILIDRDSVKNKVYALWSRYETDIHLRKVASSSDAEPEELSGAVFEVLKKNDDSTYVALENPAYHGLTETDPVSRITINETGTVEKLFDGEYQIKEVKAPDGYIMTGDVISFTITNGVVTDGTQSGMITYDSTEKQFTVGNEPGKPLPHTGGEGTWIYAFGGMMLLMMSALMYGFRKRYER